MKFSGFIEADISRIIQEAHFNTLQRQIFDLLINPDYGIRYNDVYIYNTLNISESKFYAVKKEIKKKIKRIIAES